MGFDSQSKSNGTSQRRSTRKIVESIMSTAILCMVLSTYYNCVHSPGDTNNFHPEQLSFSPPIADNSADMKKLIKRIEELEATIHNRFKQPPKVQSNQPISSIPKPQKVAEPSVSGSGFVFPLPPSAWQRDIDPDKRRCGGYKCMYESKTNQRLLNDPNHQGNPNRYGYLVSEEHLTPFKDMELGWNLSTELMEKFGIRTFYLTKPLEVKLDEEIVKELKKDPDRKVESDKIVGIHPIQIASKNAMEVGCAGAKQYLPFDQMYESFGNSSEALKTQALPPDELQKFEEQLSTDLNATMNMMASNEGTCIRNDFQVMVDLVTGNIYHIDLDRCFQQNWKADDVKPWAEHDCRKTLLRFTDDLLHIRKGLEPKFTYGNYYQDFRDMFKMKQRLKKIQRRLIGIRELLKKNPTDLTDVERKELSACNSLKEGLAKDRDKATAAEKHIKGVFASAELIAQTVNCTIARTENAGRRRLRKKRDTSLQ